MSNTVLDIAKDAFDYLNPFAVGLGVGSETPCGCGTLVQFSAQGHKVYGVLTATHVIEEIYKEREFLLEVHKTINRNGDVVAIQFAKDQIGLATLLDKKHLRHIIGGHKSSYEKLEHDITHCYVYGSVRCLKVSCAFIVISMTWMPIKFFFLH